MTSPIARIALILASADLDASDFRALERWLDKNPPRRLGQLIEDLRDVAEGKGFGAQSIRRGSSHPPYDDVVDRVERLLLDEAALSKSEAALALQQELRVEGVPSSAVPAVNRTAFARWLEQVADRISPSLLLHLATRVRNNLVHTDRDLDWPLKSDEA